MNSRNILRLVILVFFALVFAGWLRADSSHARIIRLSLVQGDVRFARDVKGDPLTSDKATWEGATLNLPIRQGYVLATDHGRAEVEFENGAMAFLAENTVLEFYDLSLEDGAKSTRLVLRQGTASFYVNPGNGDYFSVTGGDFTAEADGRARFRLDNFDDGSVVDVTKGRVNVLRRDKNTLLVKGQSLSMRAGDKESPEIARLSESDDFDRWVSGREEAVVTATNAGQQYMNSGSYSSGVADLYTYGSWYPISGYGNCWRPYGVGLGWSPFASGSWFMDASFGWAFVGSQPWGWLPYHYGGWVFEPGFGWLWSPGLGFGGFNGFVPFRPVTGVFIRSKTGLLGGGRSGFAASSGGRRAELESDESGAAGIAYEYGSGSVGCASASFAHDCWGRQRGAGGHAGPEFCDCVRRAGAPVCERCGGGAERFGGGERWCEE